MYADQRGQANAPLSHGLNSSRIWTSLHHTVNAVFLVKFMGIFVFKLDNQGSVKCPMLELSPFDCKDS